MKELSIEEKAQAYDEALKWMENVYPTLSHEQQMEAEVFFPIFKESEDERIRKELLEHCKSQAEPYIQTGNECPQIQSWIAWLEKQDKQKPVELSDNKKNLVEIITERMLKENPIPELKGKEKADFENEFNRFKQITGMINWPAREEIYKKVILWFIAWSKDHLSIGTIENDSEMDKPVEWSEDEKIRTKLLNLLKELLELGGVAQDTWSMNDCEQFITWLEKQRSKSNWCHHEVDLSNCSEEYRKAYYDGWYNCSIQHSQCKSDRNDVVKCLINGMKFYYEDNKEATWGTEKFSMKVKDILSWLEKQGEKLTLPIWKYKKDNTPLLRDSIILNKYGCVAKSPSGALISDVWVIDYAELAKLPKEEIEEQGEKKPIVVPKFREGDRIIEKSFDECGCGTIKEIKDGKYIFDDGSFVNIEEQDLWQLVEQKPVDKVESKFHEGDWVVSPNGVYWHIDKIFNNRYEVTSNTGESSDWNLDTNIYHKFTIQDAKDGDVLIDKSNDRECPFIFKATKPSDIKTDILNPLAVLGYCGIGGAGFTKGSGWGDTANCIYYPATKEQRDTLEKAMADAGYTFDFKKKELKKIEAKPTEWNEEDIMRIDNIIAIIEGKGYPDYVRRLESLKDRVSPQPKQEWSKEDEEMLLSAIEYVCTFSAYRNSVVDWLKSLKNRVQPQPNPEWSEEDDYNLQCMIAKVTSDIQKGNVGRNNELIDWLKSLRYKTGSQKYWKPSESEIKILEDILNGKIDNYQEVLRNLLEQLKILHDYE